MHPVICRFPRVSTSEKKRIRALIQIRDIISHSEHEAAESRLQGSIDSCPAVPKAFKPIQDTMENIIEN